METREDLLLLIAKTIWEAQGECTFSELTVRALASDVGWMYQQEIDHAINAATTVLDILDKYDKVVP